MTKFTKPIRKVRKTKRTTKKSSMTKLVSNTVSKALAKTTEQKWIYAHDGENTVGQIFINASGHYSAGLLPTFVRGTDNGEMIGDKIYPKSFNFKIAFKQQSNSIDIPMHITIMLVKIVTQSPTLDFVLGNLLEPNTMIVNSDAVNIFDTLARRDDDYHKEYSIVAKKHIFFGSEAIVNNPVVGQTTLNYKFPRGRYLRYDESGTAIEVGYRLVLLCDHGNRGGTLSTLTSVNSVPMKTANTGMGFGWSLKMKYTD